MQTVTLESEQMRPEHHEPDARDELIQEYMPLVRSLARRFAGRGEQLEDLVQVGSIGLMRSAWSGATT